MATAGIAWSVARGPYGPRTAPACAGAAGVRVGRAAEPSARPRASPRRSSGARGGACSGASAGGRRDERRDRAAAGHRPEDRRPPRLGGPREARRVLAPRGGRGRGAPARHRGGRRRARKIGSPSRCAAGRVPVPSPHQPRRHDVERDQPEIDRCRWPRRARPRPRTRSSRRGIARCGRRATTRPWWRRSCCRWARASSPPAASVRARRSWTSPPGRATPRCPRPGPAPTSRRAT